MGKSKLFTLRFKKHKATEYGPPISTVSFYPNKGSFIVFPNMSLDRKIVLNETIDRIIEELNDMRIK